MAKFTLYDKRFLMLYDLMLLWVATKQSAGKKSLDFAGRHIVDPKTCTNRSSKDKGNELGNLWENSRGLHHSATISTSICKYVRVYR